jgi:hypothetical protein
MRFAGEISGSHDGDYEDVCLQGCCAVQSCESYRISEVPAASIIRTAYTMQHSRRQSSCLENHLASVFVKKGGSMVLTSETTSVWQYMQVIVAVGVHAS